ncbi:hypothetical protein RI054_08g41420 [Pseudoscourfieldia marina]
MPLFMSATVMFLVTCVCCLAPTRVFCTPLQEDSAAADFEQLELISKPCAGYARSFSSYQVSEVRNAVRAALKKRCDAETNQLDASDACKAHHTDRYARLGHAEMTRVLHGLMHEACQADASRLAAANGRNTERARRAMVSIIAAEADAEAERLAKAGQTYAFAPPAGGAHARTRAQPQDAAKTLNEPDDSDGDDDRTRDSRQNSPGPTQLLSGQAPPLRILPYPDPPNADASLLANATWRDAAAAGALAQAERRALRQLFSSCSVPAWRDDAHVLLDDAVDGESRRQRPEFTISHCALRGVDCLGREVGVARLSLPSQGLKCPFPRAALAGLPLLQQLDLSGNRIIGALSMDLMQTLPHLTAIDVSANELARLSKLLPAGSRAKSKSDAALEVLQMGANRIDESLDLYSVFAAFPHLRLVNASTNRLAGSLPLHLPRQLEVLSLAQNRLEGGIPIPHPDARLRLLDLASNRLSGTVPTAFLANAPRLRVFDASGNSLEGALPALSDAVVDEDSELHGKVPSSLKVYALSSNQFEGAVPESISRFTALATLDVSGNKLSGSLPETLLDLSALMHLNISDNRFTGSLPGASDAHEEMQSTILTSKARGLQAWPALVSFDASGNLLDGKLPSLFGGLERAEHIELGGNRLTGSLPRGLGRLKRLRRLGVCGNRIDGTIPAELAKAPSLVSLSVCDNKFSGHLPLALVSKEPSLTTLEIHGNALTFGEFGETRDVTELPVSSSKDAKEVSSGASSLSSSSLRSHADL